MATDSSTGGEGEAPPPIPPHPPTSGGDGAPRNPSGKRDSFTEQAKEDLRRMLPHLLLPMEELKTFRWADNRKALAIAGIGLLPLAILAFYGDARHMQNAFWAMALYFSALWAMFFYFVFPTPEAKVSTSALCFFGTGILAIVVLLQAYRVWPLSEVYSWTRANSGIARWVGWVLGVGLPEEACKAAMVFVVARRFGPLTPQGLLFYGLMSGLGFGIYEGVDYQWGRNARYSTYIGEYYLLNVLRLTTLPFLHAIWTGMAGYFIGFAERYPERKRGLLIVAIGLPALLHGTYNALSSSHHPLLALCIALVSVLALNLYLAKSVEFERVLDEGRGEKTEN